MCSTEVKVNEVIVGISERVYYGNNANRSYHYGPRNLLCQFMSVNSWHALTYTSSTILCMIICIYIADTKRSPLLSPLHSDPVGFIVTLCKDMISCSLLCKNSFTDELQISNQTKIVTQSHVLSSNPVLNTCRRRERLAQTRNPLLMTLKRFSKPAPILPSNSFTGQPQQRYKPAITVMSNRIF